MGKLSITTALKTVGASGRDNECTIKFTPKTILPNAGGIVELISLPIFKSLKRTIVPHDD